MPGPSPVAFGRFKGIDLLPPREGTSRQRVGSPPQTPCLPRTFQATGGSSWQRISLVFAVYSSRRCNHGGSIKAPSSVVRFGYRRKSGLDFVPLTTGLYKSPSRASAAAPHISRRSVPLAMSSAAASTGADRRRRAGDAGSRRRASVDVQIDAAFLLCEPAREAAMSNAE